MALEAVQAQAGHVSIESTRIYLHLTNDWLANEYHQAMGAVDAHAAEVHGGGGPVSIAEVLPDPWIPKDESHREWAVLSAQAPQLAATMRRYLVQLTTFLAPRSVDVADSTLRQLARWLVAETDVADVSDITRTHVEDYKVWLAAQPGCTGPTLAKNTQRQRLRMIRIFLERLIEWDWPEAHQRNPILHGDIPPRPEPLPKFLSDEDAAKLLAAAKAHRLPRYRLVVEMLSRTGMRATELCELAADAVSVARRVPLAADPGWQAAQRPDDPAPPRARPAAARSGRRRTESTSGPNAASWPTSTSRSTGAPSTASSPPPPRGRGSGTPIPTNSATPWPPKPSTGACVWRPSPTCSVTGRWT